MLVDWDRPLVADFCCCAGGGAMGYWRAGLQPIGIDIKPQEHYPFPFLEADALKVLSCLNGGGTLLDMASSWSRELSSRHLFLSDFALLHASWPCQLFTRYRNLKSVRESTDKKYLNLIPQGRELMKEAGLPYVIENVEGARAELVDPIMLCGTSFWTRVRRHRLFELGGWKVEEVPPCAHHRYTDRIFPGSTNRPSGRTVCNVGERRVPVPVQKEHMKLDWHVTLEEISEMVPPVMTQFLGEEFLKTFG